MDVEFNEYYTLINLNGALLFNSGEATIREEVLPVMEKIAVILNNYTNNLIEIEGHTDNVPPAAGEQYSDNDILSMYRALNVANYIRDNTTLDPAQVTRQRILRADRRQFDSRRTSKEPKGRDQDLQFA